MYNPCEVCKVYVQFIPPFGKASSQSADLPTMCENVKHGINSHVNQPAHSVNLETSEHHEKEDFEVLDVSIKQQGSSKCEPIPLILIKIQ